MVGNLQVDKLHMQLRRMKRNSNFSENVNLTAIPEHRSKCLFTFSPSCGETEKSSTASKSTDVEELAGFIMCEGGFEDISLRVSATIYNVTVFELTFCA